MSARREFTQTDLPAEKPAKRKIVRKRVSKSDGVLENKKLKQELKEIYQNDDGSMPNMADFQKKKNGGFGRALFTLLFACAFLGAVAWAGFFVFQPKSGFAEKDVVLSVSGDSQLIPGQLTVYRLNYRNEQKISLHKAVLQVRYPEGFVLESVSQEAVNEKKDEWNLGTIAPAGSGYIELKGRFYGDFDKEQSFRVFLNYVPENFNSDFQKIFNFKVGIKDSPIDWQITAPTEAVSGSKIDLLVGLKKIENELKNFAVVVDGGKNFSVSSSSLPADPGQVNQWNFGEITADLNLNVQGVISGDETGETELIFKLVGWKDDKKEGGPYIFKTEKVKIKMVKADLGVALVANGATEKLFVQPGETINTTISLKNSGQSDLKNLQVRLIFDTPSYNNKSMLNWAKIDDRADGLIEGEQVNAEVRRGMITWNSHDIKELSVLEAGKELLIDVALPLKDGQTADLTNFTSHLITISASVQYDLSGEEKSVLTNQLLATVNSDLGFETRDRLSINSQDKEVHNVDWILTNSFHELKDVEISAEIFGDFVWDDGVLAVSGGEAKFDAVKKILTWKIPTLPTSLDILNLKFGLTLITKNPTQTNLTSKVKIKALDTITGSEINLEGDEVLLK